MDLAGFNASPSPDKEIERLSRKRSHFGEARHRCAVIVRQWWGFLHVDTTGLRL